METFGQFIEHTRIAANAALTNPWDAIATFSLFMATLVINERLKNIGYGVYMRLRKAAIAALAPVDEPTNSA